ncbi:MAG TPA: hypothetical protein VE969_09860 [Pyrinomonadaceae bacterium]|nr:hypothetical protein [Pyrinomonadaceae bacterium]
MMIEAFGPRVTKAWNGLRAPTRKLLERAWDSTSRSVPQVSPSPTYDPHADDELRQLLTALDEHVSNAESTPDRESAIRLADACAALLSQQTQSAEVYAQLIARAHQRSDYAQVDALAGLLPERLAPSEVCELARAGNVVVRALAQEALTQMPTALLAILLRDPIDSMVARQALERQAFEFGSPEAQRALRQFDESGLEEF